MVQTMNVPTRVRQIARLIHQMDADERRLLAQLVPDLQATRLSEEQTELYTYFEPRLRRLADARPMLDDDPFIAGLSVGQFFALSEEQQLRIWNQAHTAAEHDLKAREIKPHARAA
jgi:hypothetical protein